MRQLESFVYFTRKEEKGIFECYFEARRQARMDSHRYNLKLVQQNMIEGNRVLTTKVWNNFCTNLMELDIDTSPILDVIQTHPKYLSNGACYRVPSRELDPIGHMKAINARQKWRAKFRVEFEDEQMKPELRLVKSGVS